jgi:hypothetical protein
MFLSEISGSHGGEYADDSCRVVSKKLTDVIRAIRPLIALMMEVVRTSETSVNF